VTSGVYVDDGVSGWSYKPEQRPACSQLLNHCRANPRPRDRPGEVWIWSLSRLGRFPDGPEEAIYHLYDLRRIGWVVRSLTQPELDSTADGAGDRDRLLRVIRAALESEKDTASSEEKSRLVSRGKAFSMQRGAWSGGMAPFGYTRWAVRLGTDNTVSEWIEALPGNKRNGNPGAVTVLQPNDDARWVERIFEWCADGDEGRTTSMKEVARRLNDAGVKPYRGGKRWYQTTVAKVLSNEAYLALQRDRDDTAIPALWAPIIDSGLWHRARRRLEQNRALRRGANSDYALTGLVFCARCGARYSGDREKSGCSSSRLYYRAAGRDLRHACTACARRIPVEELEAPVLEQIGSLADHPIVRKAVHEEVLAATAGSQQGRSRLAEIEEQIRQVHAGVDRLIDAIAAGGAVGVRAQERSLAMNEQVTQLEDERRRLLSSRSGDGPSIRAAKKAQTFAEAYARATPAERKLLVRCFVARIEVDGSAGTARVAFLRPE
jgi:hypothetical protein